MSSESDIVLDDLKDPDPIREVLDKQTGLPNLLTKDDADRRIIKGIHRLTKEIGHIPSATEFKGNRTSSTYSAGSFDSFEEALYAAGMPTCTERVVDALYEFVVDAGPDGVDLNRSKRHVKTSRLLKELKTEGIYADMNDRRVGFILKDLANDGIPEYLIGEVPEIEVELYNDRTSHVYEIRVPERM